MGYSIELDVRSKDLFCYTDQWKRKKKNGRVKPEKKKVKSTKESEKNRLGKTKRQQILPVLRAAHFIYTCSCIYYMFGTHPVSSCAWEGKTSSFWP